MKKKLASGLPFDVEAVACAIAKAVAEQIAPLQQRIAALEAAQIKYLGVWEPDRAYGQNSMVTHGGSMWFAKRATCHKPGEDPEHWQLCVKRGKDSR